MGNILAGAAILNDGDSDALLDLGFSCSTGSRGCPFDLVSAHKWFNLAALAGSSEAQHCRAEVANQMTQREIAQAQRQARAWLASRSTH